jgi:hypothetical protein
MPTGTILCRGSHCGGINGREKRRPRFALSEAMGRQDPLSSGDEVRRTREERYPPRRPLAGSAQGVVDLLHECSGKGFTLPGSMVVLGFRRFQFDFQEHLPWLDIFEF